MGHPQVDRLLRGDVDGHLRSGHAQVRVPAGARRRVDALLPLGGSIDEAGTSCRALAKAPLPRLGPLGFGALLAPVGLGHGAPFYLRNCGGLLPRRVACPG